MSDQNNHELKPGVFWFLMLICLLGTAVFILFYVGVESGQPQATKLLQWLIRHAVIVILALVVMGGLVSFYPILKKKR